MTTVESISAIEHQYYYMLIDKVVIPVENDDEFTWAKWFRYADRVVRTDYFNGVLVLTVFLGVNRQRLLGLPPMLFETMILGGFLDHWQWRCSTYEQAEVMHIMAKAMVDRWRWIPGLVQRPLLTTIMSIPVRLQLSADRLRKYLEG